MSKILNQLILSVSILLLSINTTKAQQPTAIETLKQAEAYYKTNKIFNLKVSYSMYKGYSGNHITESYKGSIYRSNEVTQIKILNSEILQFTDTQVIINDDNKTLIYNTVFDKNLYQSPLDVSTFLNFYKEVSTQVSSTSIIHEMVLKSTQLPIPYGKIIIHFNREDYSIEKQVLYLSQKVPFVDKNGEESVDVGRLVISFKPNLNSVRKPQLEDYILFGSNKELHLSKAYASYSVIDQSNL